MLPCSLLRRASRSSVVGVVTQREVRLPSAVGPDGSADFSSCMDLGNDKHDIFSPAAVLNDENRGNCVLRLSRNPGLRLPSPPPPDGSRTKPKEAAVLVPLCVVDGEVCLLFTLRSPRVSSHRGQVSFPGGMKDDGDASHEMTALRETEEELGFPSDRIEVWGRCPPMESVNRVAAVPIIGNLGHINVQELKFNPDEVKEVFTMSLRHLCDKNNFRYTQFRSGKGYSIPVFLGGNHRVWGLTASVTHIF